MILSPHGMMSDNGCLTGQCSGVCYPIKTMAQRIVLDERHEAMWLYVCVCLCEFLIQAWIHDNHIRADKAQSEATVWGVYGGSTHQRLFFVFSIVFIFFTCTVICHLLDTYCFVHVKDVNMSAKTAIDWHAWAPLVGRWLSASCQNNKFCKATTTMQRYVKCHSWHNSNFFLHNFLSSASGGINWWRSFCLIFFYSVIFCDFNTLNRVY